MSGVTAPEAQLVERARAILRDNDRGGYTVPTPGLYPFQWNWDSAFVALGLATFDRDRAWRELETLLGAQWADGMVPHIVFHRDDPGYFPGPQVWASGTTPATSCITQPPIAATVVRELWQRDGADPDHPRLRTIYPRLLAWHDWFARHRDPLDNGLVLTVHPWETGRDNSAEWDPALARIDTSAVSSYTRRDTSHVDPSYRPTKAEYDRYVALLDFGRARRWDAARIAAETPFRMIDVGMSMILLRANRDLAAIADALGHSADAQRLRRRVAQAEAGLDLLWHDGLGAFCSLDLADGRLSGLMTSASFLAFFAHAGTPAQRERLAEGLARLGRELAFLVPSLAPGSSGYDPRRYWRGPVWLVVNYLIGRGLAELGQRELAERVRRDALTLVARHGFYEYYSPETGQGVGGGSFSWTAAIVLAWQDPAC